MEQKILIVDDDALVRDFFLTILPKRGYAVTTAEDGEEALEKLAAEPFDLIISDIKMPRRDGLSLLNEVIGRFPITPVIMLTAFGSIEGAVQAMRLGAFDYLAKPVTDLGQLDMVLNRGMRHRMLMVENQQLKVAAAGSATFAQMVGPGKKMQRVFELVKSVAPSNATVLITGPSGTGKELVARAIHNQSARSSGPFIRVNCAALPEGLVESELFGHEKGSYTGAYRATKGRIEAANGGTLLLDEIGEMPVGTQAKLLRALQEREIERVGSVESVKVDIRLVATTNVDLEKAVAEGKFRQDLFHRINVIPIQLPSLSDRRDDIPMLAYHFLRRASKNNSRPIDKISDSAMKHLVSRKWEGNVRELENAIERAVVLSTGLQLEIKDFYVEEAPEDTFEAFPTASYPADLPSSSSFEPITIEELEKRHILATLDSLGGHRLRTAEQLGISIRTLRNKLNEYKFGEE